MQQPYRHMALASGAPMTCLDPPRRPPCEGVTPPLLGPRAIAAIGTFLLVLLAAGPAALGWLAATRGQAGRVEIAPEALARYRALRHSAPRVHVPPPPVARPPATPRVVLPWLASAEHDPSRIAARARRMQAMGVDVTVVDVELAPPTVDSFATFEQMPRLAPRAFYTGTQFAALDVGDLPADSPALAAGLQRHDLLLSIDGYPVVGLDPTDLASARARGSAALEIERGGRRILLTIRWSTKAGRA